MSAGVGNSMAGGAYGVKTYKLVKGRVVTDTNWFYGLDLAENHLRWVRRCGFISRRLYTQQTAVSIENGPFR